MPKGQWDSHQGNSEPLHTEISSWSKAINRFFCPALRHLGHKVGGFMQWLMSLVTKYAVGFSGNQENWSAFFLHHQILENCCRVLNHMALLCGYNFGTSSLSSPVALAILFQLSLPPIAMEPLTMLQQLSFILRNAPERIWLVFDKSLRLAEYVVSWVPARANLSDPITKE